MREIDAPDGFMGTRYYRDRLGWVVAAKPTRATWWKELGFIGHEHLTEEELDRRAADKVREWATRQIGAEV